MRGDDEVIEVLTTVDKVIDKAMMMWELEEEIDVIKLNLEEKNDDESTLMMKDGDMVDLNRLSLIDRMMGDSETNCEMMMGREDDLVMTDEM